VNKQEFLGVLETLTDFYDRTPPKKQLEAWYWKLKHLDHQVAREAAEEITSCLPAFPTPAKFLEFADQARARKSHNDNVSDRKQAERFFDPGRHNPGLARDSVQLMLEILKMPVSKERFEFTISGCESMAKKYPHLANEYLSQAREAKKNLELWTLEHPKEAVNG